MSQEFRRSRRRKAEQTIAVKDAMTGQTVGRIDNVSSTGLLLALTTGLNDDALYQLNFELPGADGRPIPLEVGTHLLWSIQHGAQGTHWAGLRFIALSQHQSQVLKQWVEAPGSQYG